MVYFLYLVVLNNISCQMKCHIQIFACHCQVDYFVDSNDEQKCIDYDEAKDHPRKGVLDKEGVDRTDEVGVNGEVDQGHTYFGKQDGTQGHVCQFDASYNSHSSAENQFDPLRLRNQPQLQENEQIKHKIFDI